MLASPVPMVTLWGGDGVMVYNDGYARIAGARHPGLMGARVREGWPEVADFNDNVVRTGLAGRSLSFTDCEMTLHRNIHPEQVFFDLNYSPIFDDGAVPAGVLCVVSETTSKVRAERWREGEQARLRMMFEQAPGFMALLRGPDHVFEYVNAAYQGLVGDRELVGRSVREALPEIPAQGFVNMLDEAYMSGQPVAGHALPVLIQRQQRADVERRYVDFVYQPMRNGDGAVYGICVQGSDVTERVQAERDRRESENRLRRAQEVGGVGVFTMDLETDIISGTPEFCRIFGIEPADKVAAAVLEALVLPEDAMVMSDRERRRSGGADLAVEYRIRRTDTGEVRTIARRAEYERDGRGRYVRMLGVVQDVTESRRVQRALAESELQFRSFAQAMPNQLWTARPDGRLEWFNDRFADYVGWPARDRPSTIWTETVHPGDRADAAEEWREALATESSFETEIRLQRTDGTWRWHLCRALPIQDGAGDIIRWVGTNTDIHDRKLAEAETSKARDRMWTMSQNVMLVCDLDGVITAINPSGVRQLGWVESEMVGRRIAEFVHPVDLAATQAELGRLASGLTTMAFENRYRTRSGEYRLLDWTAVPDSGRIHAIGRDITQERAIARDQERIWTLSPVLKVVASPDGTVLKTNPAWRKLFRNGRGSSPEPSFADVVVPEDRTASAALFERLTHGTVGVDHEFTMVAADDSRRHIAWSFVPEAGTIYGFGRDVTDQRLAEDALRQSQKMEAVGQLTGGIAHDFNNLLQGITGNLDVVQRRISLGRTSGLERFVEGAVTSANRAAALTHRLLAFSRRQPLDPRPVEVNPLVASTEDLLRRTLGERIKLEFDLADGLWLTRCDPNQLESALLNLAINARDAMPDGGRLSINTANLDVSRSMLTRQMDLRPGQYVTVSVTDTGTGMSAETAAKAFEPFFTTKPIGQGTGLGLSMIYGFARQSGGDTKIFSELGRGTTVLLYLPRYIGDPVPSSPDQSPVVIHGPPGLEHRTILLVEDEPVVRDVVAEVLSECGYRVLQASDGLVGLQTLESRSSIDLLITDIGLPGMNGRQLAERAVALRPGLPVLLMTGYAEKAAVIADVVDPGMQLITKPVALDALVAKVRAFFDAHLTT